MPATSITGMLKHFGYAVNGSVTAWATRWLESNGLIKKIKDATGGRCGQWLVLNRALKAMPFVSKLLREETKDSTVAEVGSELASLGHKTRLMPSQGDPLPKGDHATAAESLKEHSYRGTGPPPFLLPLPLYPPRSTIAESPTPKTLPSTPSLAA